MDKIKDAEQLTLVNEKPAKSKAVVKQVKTVEKKELSFYDMATRPDVDPERIKMLIDLKNAEEDRACKKEFDFHFAEMQKDFKLIPKDKDGSKTNAGVIAFKYAPIENYQSINGWAISEHKFSYSWTEQPLENGVLRVRIHISGYGYTKSDTYTDVPVIATNSLTTESQARNAQKGVGKRITYADGFGMIAVGEDMYNSLSFEDGTKYADLEQRLAACTTREALNLAAKTIREELAKAADKHGEDVLRTLYGKRRKELEK